MARTDPRQARRRPGRRSLLLLGAFTLLFASCENVFTTSLFSFLQRDPSKLSPEQQVAYGRDALASGDPEAMAEAYGLLKDSDDPETQLLAADLALGAVELEATLLEAASAEDPVATIEEALDDFTDEDYAMMREAAALVDSADESVEPSAEQYFFAAAGLIAAAADENGGTAGLDADPPPAAVEEEVNQAKAFLDAAAASLQANGESTDVLEGVGEAIGWSP